MKQRIYYEAPETDVLLVRFEQNLLDSTDGYGREKEAGQNFNSRTYNEDF